MSADSTNERRGSCASNPSNDSTSAPSLLQRTTQKQTKNRDRPSLEPHYMSSTWLVSKLLRNSDVSLPNVPRANANNLNENNAINNRPIANAGNGDICLFHYPTAYIPKLTVEEMARGFELLTELGRVYDEQDDENGAAENIQAMFYDVEVVQGQITNMDMQGDFRRFVVNSSQRVRDQITRLQISWYQFEELPREVVGRTYRNLRHVDIRQNASLTCIESIIEQLPQLTSLNISDCPNLHTLTPLAKYNGASSSLENNDNQDEPNRYLNLRHLWVRGCNLSTMTRSEWSAVFDALSKSTGPIERMTLSRNNMRYLEGGIGKLKSLNYLFVEDNINIGSQVGVRKTFELPEEIGSLTNLRFLSLCGNNITHLPRTMGRLNLSCDINLQRNFNLIYPPAPHAKSVQSMRVFFHKEKMALFLGSALFVPHVKRSQVRANERLYCPGGLGYFICRERFEETARRSSIAVLTE